MMTRSMIWRRLRFPELYMAGLRACCQGLANDKRPSAGVAVAAGPERAARSVRGVPLDAEEMQPCSTLLTLPQKESGNVLLLIDYIHAELSRERIHPESPSFSPSNTALTVAFSMRPQVIGLVHTTTARQARIRA
jgi:hypothetical protein